MIRRDRVCVRLVDIELIRSEFHLHQRGLLRIRRVSIFRKVFALGNVGSCADEVAMASNGYESSASESTPTVHVTAINPRADSTVSFPL